VKLTKVADQMPNELIFRDNYGYLVIEDPSDLPKVNPPKTIRFDEERAVQLQRGKGLINLLPGAIA
jgi:hypothetical protein